VTCISTDNLLAEEEEKRKQEEERQKEEEKRKQKEDELLDDLQRNVSSLKEIATSIHEELSIQNQLIDAMDNKNDGGMYP
jgi:hypothetical protein